MQSITVYDLIVLQGYFANKKEPTEREKTAAADLDQRILELTESLQVIGPMPRPSR
jgi:hypothetical protein